MPLTLNQRRALANGLTFNFADEITSGLSALGAGLPGSDAYKKAYEDILQDARKDYKRYTEENPVSSTLLEIAGGIPTGSVFTKGLDVVGRRIPQLTKLLRTGSLGRSAVEGGMTGAALVS